MALNEEKVVDSNQDGIYEFVISPSMERFYSEDSEYGVYEFSTKDKIPHTRECILFEDGNMETNIGVMAGNTGKLEYGVDYNIRAEIEYNSKYKSWQYKPIEIYPIVPTKLDQAEKFLKSIITVNQTKALLEKYPNIIDMVMNKEEIDLSDVKGIKEKSFEKIKDKIESTYGMMELAVFLSPLGVSAKAIQKLFESGTNAKVIKKQIQENPYIISNISGFGFKRADAIALKINPLLKVSKYRTVAFIRFLLKDVANNYGHTWVNVDKFLEECRKNIPECKEIIFEILKEGTNDFLYIDRERKRVGLKSLYKLELNIAVELIRLKNGYDGFRYGDIDKKIKEIEDSQGWDFTDEQIDGVKLLINNQVIAITGGAGVGKTSVATAMTKILERYSIAQTALSGKAALRIQEVTGLQASTIHRLLGFKEGKFMFNKSNPLLDEVVVIDEASMIGADLFYSLLQAIPSGSKVIIMGDVNQLESIGVGSVFKDILDSGVIPTIKLTKIHRQAQKSAIITESIKVKDQKHIIDKDFYGTRILGELQDLHLDIYEDKDETSDRIIRYFKREYEELNDIMEIQIAVPMKEKGSACVYRLNNRIQEIVNPSNIKKKEVNLNIRKGLPYVIREGDKVMNMVNQYNTEDTSGNVIPVFNGNLGIVKQIYHNYMVVDFVGIGELVIEKKNWSNIELGYASTAHKLQGSQFDTIIVGVDSSSYVMLSKEWLYTAITRAKKMCYLCGDNLSIRTSVKQSNLVKKLTHLKEFLVEKDYLKNNE